MDRYIDSQVDINLLNMRPMCQIVDRQIQKTLDRSQMSNMLDRSQMSNMLERSQMSNMLDRSQMSNMLDRSQMSNILDRFQMSNMLDRSQMSNMLDRPQWTRVNLNSNRTDSLYKRGMYRAYLIQCLPVFNFDGHFSFGRSKCVHLLIAPIEGFLYQLDNDLDGKIDVIPQNYFIGSEQTTNT